MYVCMCDRAFPIARALDLKADVVITGRCVDSALVLGPLIHKVSTHAWLHASTRSCEHERVVCLNPRDIRIRPQYHAIIVILWYIHIYNSVCGRH